MSDPPTEADAVVIGGGPAGCTVAILLRQYNPQARIVLIEKDDFPRHHVGESTLPDANAVLQKIGVVDDLNRAGFPIKCGLTYKWRHDRPMFSDVFSRGVHANLQERLYPRGVPDHAWQVERGRYDQILLNRAKSVGVDVVQRALVTGLLRDETDTTSVGGVVLRTSPEDQRHEIRARHTVDASGQARVLSRHLGLEAERYPLGDTALYRYYDGFSWNEELLGSFFDGKIFFTSVPRGWMWFIPLSESRASVGLVTKKTFLESSDPADAFAEEIENATEIRAMLHDARHVSHDYTDAPPATYAVQDWTYRNHQLTGPGWYLVGDAAAFVDPILSSGINIAHNCGLLVANAINTEWNVPSVPTQSVRDGYQGLYNEIYESFLSMATWWYERRHTDIRDWWKQAGSLVQHPAGVADLSDREVFLAFTAGYVTDFRFANIGAGGFGAQGLNNILDHLPDQPIEERMHRPDLDVDATLKPAFDGFRLAQYCGSHVGTDRWWQLPVVIFRRGDDETAFHPSILESEADDERLLVEETTRMATRLLEYIDGSRSARAVGNALQEDFGGFDQKIHNGAMKMIHNLLTLKLLVVD